MGRTIHSSYTVHMEDIFLKRFEKLNERQKKAVITTDGPVMVVAGPGTGKTELLALRVVHIIREGLAKPSSLLCLTFTDNACLNMRERLVKLIGDNAYRVPIFTFHSFSSYVMGRFPEHFFDAASFTLADDIVRAEILEHLFKSLPHGHPFASYHPSEGFVYLRDVKERIRHIKTGGYTGAEYKAVTEALVEEYTEVNKLFTLWPIGRLSVKTIRTFDSLLESLRGRGDTTSKLLAEALSKALTETEGLGKTEPLANFKKKYLVTDGEVVLLKDFYNREKLLALLEIYCSYEKAMREKGYYDFDDMILEVSHALHNNAFMRSELEEEYQYIMIDEFQDTNEAQMNLVRELTSSPLHEGRPNVLVVGDDDQAIYKFQGAEVSHLMRFREKLYRDVKTIVLNKNYRSSKEVLALARATILQGKDRLENHFVDITKELINMNEVLPKGEIVVKLFATESEENMFIMSTLQNILLKKEACDIAVLARGHKELRSLIPYLDRAGIPYEYSKKANVFQERHVHELIVLSEYLSSYMENTSTKDYLIPEILSFPFFAISRKSLFKLALTVKKEHTDWLTAGSESDDEKLREVCTFLILMGGEAKVLPLLNFLKKIIEETPFKEFYFSKDTLKNSPDEYVYFLSSLRTFLDALAGYKEGEVLTAKEVGDFVALHKSHNVSLTADTISVKKKNSIKLMTAHASKGLEFGSVFILSAKDSLWVKGARGSKVPLPFPLKPFLEPAGDNEDDFLRLFYVALTRAKHSLYITSHEEMIRFVGPSEKGAQEKDEQAENKDASSMLESALSLFSAPLVLDEKEIVHKLVEGYQMPVTHLQNFCNVIEGGPLYFLEQNLLRFPQPMNASALFGSAVHKVIEEIVKYKKYNAGENPPLEKLIAFFDQALKKGRLPDLEEKKALARGHTFLKEFYARQKEYFLWTDEVEVDFSREGVIIGGAHLTGKVDFLRKEKDGYLVVDFKTGDSYSAWDESKLSDYEKLKLHKYRQQLIVYDLLLAESKTYKVKAKNLALSFVEDGKSKLLYLDASELEVTRMKKLIEAVYTKIITCDFVDISKYEKNSKGVLAFEEDLIEGAI